jgi:lipase (class 3)
MSKFVELPRSAYPKDALDGFKATSQLDHVNFDTARAMMWLSQLAYETASESKVDDILKAWELTKLGFVSNDRLTGLPPHSACVVVAEGRGATFITFAGSDPGKAEDWVTDFEATPSPDDLHSGFKKAVETVLPAIQTAIANRTAPAQPLFFTGHSLGGALAILAASLASLEPKVPQVVYTFGGPRTGGDKFFDNYSPRLGDFTFRFIHGTDIVPTVPPTLPDGYRHVGRAVQCRSGHLFDGVEPKARDGNDPDILQSAAQAAAADFEAPKLLQFVHALGEKGLRDQVIAVLPRMVRDHVPQNYFRALSITLPPFGLLDEGAP